MPEETSTPDSSEQLTVSSPATTIPGERGDAAGSGSSSKASARNQAIDKSGEQGDAVEVLPGFSVSATKLFYVQLNKYLVDLERFSRFKGKQASADVVSSQHVREAAIFLSASRITSRVSRSCETIGGLLLGGGISELITLLQDNRYSAGLVLLTAVLIMTGGAMIGIFLGRD